MMRVAVAGVAVVVAIAVVGCEASNRTSIRRHSTRHAAATRTHDRRGGSVARTCCHFRRNRRAPLLEDDHRRWVGG